MNETRVSRAGLSWTLGTASFAFALESLTTWLFISYFQFSVVMALVLLVLGFPLGAILAHRLLGDDLRSLRRALMFAAAFQALNLVSLGLLQHVAAALHMGGRRDVTWIVLLGQGLALYLLFLPLFAAWGMLEYQGYRLGRRVLPGGTRSVYALYLLALALAYGVGRLTIGRFGLAHTLLAAIVVGGLLAAGACTRRRWLIGVPAIALGAILFTPGLERRFLDLAGGPYYLHGLQGRRVNFAEGYEIVEQRWTSSYLFSLISTPAKDTTLGFYNNHLYWVVEDPRRPQPPDALALVPRGGRVAILGPGGGRQIVQAAKVGAGEIHAIDVRTEVVDLLDGPWAGRVWNAWKQPGVIPVAMDGRNYMERVTAQFDVIALPFTEASPFSTRAIFDVSERLHTFEAFRVFADRLAPGGFIQIKKLHPLDPRRELRARYLAALRALGLKTYVLYWSFGWYEVLAFKQPTPERIEQIDRTLAGFGPALRRIEVDLAPAVALVHDDNPYQAGVTSTIIRQETLRRIGWILLGTLAPLAVLVVVLFARRVPAGGTGVGRLTVGSLALLAGVNFVVLESEVIYRLTPLLPSPEDALYAGTLGFVACTFIGSLLPSRRLWLPWLGVLAALPLALPLALGQVVPDAVALTMLVPALVSAGGFFPRAFEAAPQSILGVFGLDAVGASLGGAISLFLPATVGLRAHTLSAVTIFALTLAATMGVNAVRSRVNAG